MSWKPVCCERCGRLLASHRNGECYPDTAPGEQLAKPSEQTFEEWWKEHSNGLLPKGSVIEYNARAAWNAAKGEKS